MSDVKITYAIVPYKREQEGDEGYAITSIIEGKVVGVIPFASLEALRQFLAKGVDYCQSRAKRDIPEDILKEFNGGSANE